MSVSVSATAAANARPHARKRVLPLGSAGALGRVAVLTVSQAGLLVGAGLLITGPAEHVWPLTVEDRVDEGLEGIRTGTLTTLSSVGSEGGNTLTVVIGTLLVCLGLLLIPRLPMWRQAVFLAVAVSTQALVFLLITLSVDRDRPDVHRLDASPPTSSYTSGHTGAATALYTGLAVLVLTRVRRPWRKALAGLLLLLPLLVGLARLYRGMHHPTDVVGGLVNGLLSVAVAARLLLIDASVTAEPHPATDAPADAPDLAEGTVFVVHNPSVTGAGAREELRALLGRYGRQDVEFLGTTPEDPGPGQTREAVRRGAALVVVCGGDGTVRAAAEELVDSGVPLAIVPSGTGNLLARNLGLPLDPATALEAALAGRTRRIDLGRVEGDGLPATVFAVMAGAGLDAAVMERTGDRAKSALGWPAYVLAGMEEIGHGRAEVVLRLDGGPELRRAARMALVANVGALQGGIRLVPGARPDDGHLDLLILDPRGAGGWLRSLRTLLRREESTDPAPGTGLPPVEYFRFRHAELTFSAPQPREYDGETAAHGTRLTVSVLPGALTVLVPREKAAPRDARTTAPVVTA
ncbi:diacylglycerol kinase family protein [Streptomyces sp. SID11385]|uniref:diacylglycerol kinase family protein n=1 Tax=Streptomyces sp. SID11385 TaxID=2706031 RepID=UPI0013C77328|nr:diacylglycerol kinase family protein [Streptomyces sp. SID11385]NEA38803.1 phosphatase PAP2 family protein [Streptomyces sp. SID11385]